MCREVFDIDERGFGMFQFSGNFHELNSFIQKPNGVVLVRLEMSLLLTMIQFNYVIT